MSDTWTSKNMMGLDMNNTEKCGEVRDEGKELNVGAVFISHLNDNSREVVEV